jgi:dopamine receptor D1
MSIHVDRDSLSQMEIEATRSLLIGVTSLVVTVCPIIILHLTFLACRMIGKFDCNSLTWLAAYVKELGLIHAIYNPLIFLIRCKELRNALTTRLIHRG